MSGGGQWADHVPRGCSRLISISRRWGWARHLLGGWPDGGPWRIGGKWTQRRAAPAHAPIPELTNQQNLTHTFNQLHSKSSLKVEVQVIPPTVKEHDNCSRRPNMQSLNILYSLSLWCWKDTFQVFHVQGDPLICAISI